MQNAYIYTRPKHFWELKFEPERRKMIEELKSLRDDIMSQERKQAIGNIAYSTAGFAGLGLAVAGVVAAPFTFGLSLGLSGAGIAASVSSTVAAITHRKVKVKLVDKKLTVAEKSLNEHNKTTSEMISLLVPLVQNIDLLQENAGKLETEVLTSLSSYALEDAKIPRKVVAAIGSLLGVGNVIRSAIHLAEIDIGKLSSEAEMLHEVIIELEREYFIFRKCFVKEKNQ